MIQGRICTATTRRAHMTTYDTPMTPRPPDATGFLSHFIDRTDADQADAVRTLIFNCTYYCRRTFRAIWLLSRHLVEGKSMRVGLRRAETWKPPSWTNASMLDTLSNMLDPF